jgi:branched-chain amino acid transport system ATP-binding protein
MTLALEVRRLTAGYGPLRVLHGIDLELSEGERVGLIGLNGHGKTTLLRSIVGLVDWRRGQIELHGRTISRSPTYKLARAGLVMIPQGDSLFPGLTVRENLDTGAFSSRSWRTRALRRERVIDLFPRLGARLNQLAGTLSGGERRMVSVGRALMADPDVYLIDEPSLGLAPGIATGLIDTLSTLELGSGAMLIAEQNRALIAGRLDRVARLHGGEIVAIENGKQAQDGVNAESNETPAEGTNQ